MYELSKDLSWKRPDKGRLPILGVLAGTGTSGDYPTEVDFYTREQRTTVFHRGFLEGVLGMSIGEFSKRSPSVQVKIAQSLGMRWHVADAIRRGECDLHFLINTDGGFLTHHELLKVVFSYISNHGGTVSTYICDRAFSLGGSTWTLGGNRSAHKGSLAMLHTPMNMVTGSIEADPLYAERIRQLFSNVPENWRCAIMEWIDPTINPRYEVSCYGEDLEAMGISQRTFETQDDLTDHVAAQTGLKVDFEPIRSQAALMARCAAESLRIRATQSTHSTTA